METNALLEKIAADQAQTIEAIEADTQESVAAIKAQTEVAVADITAAAAVTADKAAAAINRATLAQARQAGKLTVQTAKREAFDAVMEAAFEAAVGSDAEKVRAWSDRLPALELHLAHKLSA